MMDNKPKKQRIQSITFKSTYDFFEFLPPEELKLVQFLREVIFECIPHCTEKLSYNVPYYYKHSRICFIWPSSIPWGNIKQKGVVRLGFAKGYLMNDKLNYLDKGNRKQVYWKDFTQTEDIDIPLLKTHLFEAALLDEQTNKKP